MTTPVPSVPDFIAGYGPQQSDFQGWWVNAAAFFQQRVIFRAVQASSATTLPSSGAVVTIAYDDILEDPYSGWSATSYNWTAPLGYSGWYQVTVTVWVTASGADNIVLSPYIIGDAASNAMSGYPLASVVIPNGQGGAEGTYYVYLTSGQDAVSGGASVTNSSSSVSTDLSTGTQSSLEIVWISS